MDNRIKTSYRHMLVAKIERDFYAKGIDVSIWADPGEEVEVCIWEPGTSNEIKRFWSKNLIDVSKILNDWLDDQVWLNFMEVN